MNFWHGAKTISTTSGALAALLICSCSTTVPGTHHRKFKFPAEGAYLGIPKDREYEKIGVVRARADFASYDAEHPDRDAQSVCRNYYNRTVEDLVKFSRQKGGDAVIEIKSVVFTMGGKSELHDTPECADDGAEGQVLTQGVAIKWKAKRP